MGCKGEDCEISAVGNVVQWLKASSSELTTGVQIPVSVPYELCDLQQVIYLLFPPFPHYKMENKSRIHLCENWIH